MQSKNHQFYGFVFVLCYSLLFSNRIIAAPESFNVPDSLGSVEPREVSYLESSYAQLRAQQIRNPQVDLSIVLGETTSDYSGVASINFDLAANNRSPVRFDFEGGQIKSLSVNGKAANWKSLPWFILVPANQFTAGNNQVVIEFSHPFTTTGDGLHRYKDQQSGNVYLYSNFEPFNAHKMFPHFDQPNLKAIFRLSVLAPREWVVVSNTIEKSKKLIGINREWKFPATTRISSYVFALHAGPYTIWKDRYGNIPLRLLARKEMAPYVDAKEWFKVTKEAFSFYIPYFSYRYPFKKYDQLVVPDFNSGAMENVGAVTFNERYTPRSKKSWLLKLRTASVVSHEMAHMWFGDLVTMDWWNGLWLNESFATYMSALQQAENSEFRNESWIEFYLKMKQWGYQEDQKVTTHAIELPVANTEEAFNNFDGITYGKGAAVLRQLAHYVGENNFRRGVARYLRKNEYSNATLQDFISEIEQASGKDLKLWTQNWLYSAGVNSIKVDFDCEPVAGISKIKRFEIFQSAESQTPQIRQHKLDVGLIKLKEGKVTLFKTLPIEINSEKNSIPPAVGMDCPDLVYPNLNDWGYVKVSLDKKSRDFLAQHMNELDQGLSIMLWQNMWDDVLDAKISLKEFIEFVKVNLSGEKSDKQLGTNMERLVAANTYLTQMHALGQNHDLELASIETILRERVSVAEPGSDLQRGVFESYLSVVHSAEALTEIRRLLSGEFEIKGLVVDQDLRWRILVVLNHYVFQDYLALTKTEVSKDLSDYGQQMAILAEAIRPDLQVKEKWINEILSTDSSLKFANQKVILAGLFPADQTIMRKNFENKVIQALPNLVARMSDRFMIAYAKSSFMPNNCTAESIQQTIKIRDTYANLSPSLKKVLSVNVQDEERCVAIMKRNNL